MAGEVKKVEQIGSSDLQPELDYLIQCEQKVAEFEPQLSIPERHYQKIVDVNVFDTRNLGYSIQKLKMDYEKLRSYISAQYREIEKERLARVASTGVSQEEIEYFQASFAHFDANNDHKLNFEEFRSCLISVGYDPATVENVYWYCRV
ncbi:alpha-actinin-4-like [Octopus sinensis]|uniref:Alpha-actinin-4-like n=1 Tax=Octopus sinensis TaxID=2607531 RepID=A0A6P7TWU2_9MOLL|nr:alpha-actinin-4-like [Octopus sinensis]